MTKFLNLFKWFIVLAAVFALAFFAYVGVKIGRPLQTSAEEIVFTVPKGATTKQVAHSLAEAGLLGRPWFFEVFLYLKNWNGKIQAGSYRLAASMPIREIAEKMVTGQALASEVKLTVIEGWTWRDIAEEIEARGLGKKDEFLLLTAAGLADDFEILKQQPQKYASLEGYLFPDTYLIQPETAPAAIAEKMLKNFERKFTGEMRKAASDKGQTIHEIVTAASLIEREVGRNLRRGEKLSEQDLDKLRQERREVASVFYNRLKAGRALESDATISYLTGRKGSSRATLEETKIESPYNTYKYPGLPPGPIASPSLDAILAAIYPAETDYLYFVTAEDGTAYFAKTLEEHKINRAKYLP